MTAVNRVLVVLALVALGVGFAALGAPKSDSYHYNLSWSVTFYNALAMGDPYPRYLPGLWDGYGGMDLYFYAPLPFYMSAAAQALMPGLSPNDALAVAGAIFWIGSGVTAALFLRRIVRGWAVIVGSMAYMFAPYHLSLDWVIRQAMGEFAAYMFVPLVALGMWKTLEEQRLNIILPLGFAGLSVCHLPTTLLSVPVFAAIWIAWVVKNKGQVAVSFARLTVSVAIGAGLSAIYWIPALSVLPDVSAEFLTLYDPTDWLLWNGQEWPVPGWNSVAFIMLGLTALYVVLNWVVTIGRGAPKDKNLIIWSIVPLLLAAILMTNLSAWIWSNTPMRSAQFPWRLLVYVDFTAMVAVGFVWHRITTGHVSEKRSKYFSAIWGSILIVLIMFSHWPYRSYIAEIYQDTWSSDVDVSLHDGALEYLSNEGAGKYAQKYMGEKAVAVRDHNEIPAYLQQLNAAGHFHPRESVTAIQSRIWQIANVPAGQVLLPILYHKALSIHTPDGQILPVSPALDIGVVSAEFPRAYDRVEMVVARHSSELPAALVSLFSLLVLIGMVIMGQLRRV